VGSSVNFVWNYRVSQIKIMNIFLQSKFIYRTLSILLQQFINSNINYVIYYSGYCVMCITTQVNSSSQSLDREFKITVINAELEIFFIVINIVIMYRQTSTLYVLISERRSFYCCLLVNIYFYKVPPNFVCINGEVIYLKKCTKIVWAGSGEHLCDDV